MVYLREEIAKHGEVLKQSSISLRSENTRGDSADWDYKGGARNRSAALKNIEPDRTKGNIFPPNQKDNI